MITWSQYTPSPATKTFYLALSARSLPHNPEKTSTRKGLRAAPPLSPLHAAHSCGLILTKTLGFCQNESYQSDKGNTVYVFETGPGGAGTKVHLDVRRGQPGIGGVHHVALRTPNDEEQEQWH